MLGIPDFNKRKILLGENMAHWNHRVVKKVYPNGEEEYSVREVHYNDAGEIYGYTIDPVNLANETLKDLREYIQWCLDCLDKPILEDGKVLFASDNITEKDLEKTETFDNIEDFLDSLKDDNDKV